MPYKQTHTIELSHELLIVKAKLSADGRRLTLTSEAQSKESSIRSMESFLDVFKTKLDKEKEG